MPTLRKYATRDGYYLTDYLHLSIQDMGFVASAIGFGGAIGQFAMPTISDFIGRKLATLASYILAAVFTYLFVQADASSLGALQPAGAELPAVRCGVSQANVCPSKPQRCGSTSRNCR